MSKFKDYVRKGVCELEDVHRSALQWQLWKANPSQFAKPKGTRYFDPASSWPTSWPWSGDKSGTVSIERGENETVSKPNKKRNAAKKAAPRERTIRTVQGD